MLTVNLGVALLLYMGVFLFICFGIWLRHHAIQRKKITLPPLYKLSRCEYCSFDYLDLNEKEITKCPECGSYNRST